MAQRITVTGCLGCPFAHREHGNDLPRYYCCVLPEIPEVPQVPGQPCPDFCPLRATDFYRVVLSH